MDFNAGGSGLSNMMDLIDISAIDANSKTIKDDPFTFIGSAAFSGRAGELQVSVSNGTALISGDVNGDGLADFSVFLNYTGSLDQYDFFL
jgi:serralysin